MKLLLISNFAPHYRAAIFRMMDRALGCDFVFGDQAWDLRKMDYSVLEHKVTEVRNVRKGRCCWQKGVPRMIRDDYDTYIITSDMHYLSTWVFLLRAALRPAKKVYLWSHGWLRRESAVKRLVGRIFYNLCDGAFIYNRRSRRLMIDGGIPEGKLHTIYNSLDYDAQLPIRQSLSASSVYQEHFGNSRKTVIFIGRLTAVKQLDLLIEAMAVLKAKGELYNAVFVGDGPQREQLQALAAENGLAESVWFYGACYDERRNAELIYNADLCVSPGNVGLTAMHAMMFGCPVATHDDFCRQMPEFEAITPGTTGTFFSYGDARSLADSISGWFAEHGEDREAIRLACYKEIDERWNPHVQLDILKNVLMR